MKEKRIDTSELVGKTVNDLAILSRTEDRVRPNGKRRPVYICECVCGNIIKVESQRLRGSKAKIDCGCNLKKRMSDSMRKDDTEVQTRWEAYSSYAHMIGRCYNPKEAGYENYGARGVKVCEEWRESFWNFLKDMGERPTNHVLDRIDPNLDYCPNNCRWVDKNLSSFNTRKARNNTSGRTGVYWFARVDKWIAAIHYKGSQIHLGYFTEFEDAVKAREDAEIKYFGELKDG